MGTTAEKLQKALENKQLIVDSVNTKAGTSYDINSKPSDIAQTILNITTGEKAVVLRHQVNDNNPVPNSGYIEKIYFNTSLSVDEVNSIFEDVTFLETPLYHEPVYVICFGDTFTQGIFVAKNELGVSAIVYVPNMADMTTFTLLYNVYYKDTIENWGYMSPWNLGVLSNGYLPLNINALDNYQGLPIGMENNKIINAVGTNPFNSPVPNTGYVENVYFNTDLSVDEVVAMLEPFSVKKSYFALSLLLTESQNRAIVVVYSYSGGVTLENLYIGEMIFNEDGSESHNAYFEYNANNPSLNGWKTFGQPIVINANVLNELNGDLSGIYNAPLGNLFSTKQFETSKLTGTPVPNQGTLSGLYINTSLTQQEVLDILVNANLPYDSTYGIYVVASTDDHFQNSIIIQHYGDLYAISVGLGNGQGEQILFASSDSSYWEGTSEMPLNINLLEFLSYFSNPLLSQWDLGDDGIFDVGLENSKLKDLISDTPFKEDIIVLSGEYDGSKLEISSNQVLDVEFLLNNKKLPLQIDVNVPTNNNCIVPSGSIDITNTEEVDVTNYAKAQIKDENLKAENIAENVEVLGITGTFKGGTNTSDATATANDILLGKSAYTATGKVEGTIETYDYSTSEETNPEIDRFLMNDFTEYYNDRITSIGTAFSGNLKIKSISLPNVENVSSRAFASCSSLENINLPNATSIGGEVFDGTALEYISLPSLLDVSGRTFYLATNLKTLHIPNAEIIRGQAFYKTYDIRHIIIEQDNKVCTLMDGALYQCYHFAGTVNTTYNPEGLKDGYFYVSDNMLDLYKQDKSWSQYVDQIKPLSELPQEIKEVLGL